MEGSIAQLRGKNLPLPSPPPSKSHRETFPPQPASVPAMMPLHPESLFTEDTSLSESHCHLRKLAGLAPLLECEGWVGMNCVMHTTSLCPETTVALLSGEKELVFLNRNKTRFPDRKSVV